MSSKQTLTVEKYHTAEDPKGHKPSEAELAHIKRQLQCKGISCGKIQHYYEDNVVIPGGQTINMSF